MTFDPRTLASYDHVIVAFSGGKDSLACLLHLLDLGVPRGKVELWHHDVDGREGSTLMDWPCTRDYCRAVARALGVPIYFSWKVGGFEREMLRDGTATAPIRFEVPADGRPLGVYMPRTGTTYYGTPPVKTEETGGRGPAGTRQKFPQVSPDLSVRWCSAYLKIDVGAVALRNQARFERARTLFVTGERAEESSARAKYRAFEPHRADLRHGRTPRHVDQWRPVHGWTEREVWALIERHRVNPHPAYRLGWGRVSCAACIFGNADQWASLRAVNPAQFAKVAEYERAFGLTIKRKLSVIQTADAGKPYEMAETDKRAALSATFDESAILPEGAWKLPRGAFGDNCGPT